MKKSGLLLASVIIAFFVTFQACKTDETVTPTTATVTALTCSGVTFSATATSGTSYTGTASVPYSGGSGVIYAAGTAIASTGVIGLTATLSAGTLASGAGTANFIITGTPATSGTAVFAITLGGQSCSLSLPVATASTVTPITGSSAAKVFAAVEAFKATLTAAQITTATLAYTQSECHQMV